VSLEHTFEMKLSIDLYLLETSREYGSSITLVRGVWVVKAYNIVKVVLAVLRSYSSIAMYFE
jgi:hypothetical protein